MNLITEVEKNIPDIDGAIEVLEGILKGVAVEKDLTSQCALNTLIEQVRAKHFELVGWVATALPSHPTHSSQWLCTRGGRP